LSDRSARLFSAVLHVEEDSKIAGMTLAEARQLTQGELRLLDVQRGSVMLARLPTLTFTPGDRLHVLDTPNRLKEFERVLGVSLHTLEEEEDRADAREPVAEGDESEKQRLVEIVVTQESALSNSTIRRERFADEYGLYVLAIHRGTLQHEVRRDALTDVELKPGDVLLAQGSAGHISQLKVAPTGLLVLDSIVDLPNADKALLALGIMAGVVALAATGLFPIAVSALAGVGAMLVTRCLSWAEAMRGLSVQVIMIIVTSLALGTALIATGGAEFIARAFVMLTTGLPPLAILAGLMLLMALLTNILSNNAAGIIGTPIAVSIATQLNLDPVPFVVAIVAGVNLSFATPMAYQTNLLVMHAGGYRFTDFVRLGLPLTLLMWIGYALVIPRFFPL
jgi:di/tricarboxylate transporter